MPSHLLHTLSQASPIQILIGSAAALLLLSILFRLCRYAHRRRVYMTSDYAQNTGKPMRETLSDKGSRGEYELYLHTVKHLEDEGHWLFNVYVPRPNGSTTEIDAILFHPSGIYVIESKNYRGRIVGNDRREQWTQCFKPSKDSPVRTYSFYSPLKQNQIHVDCLRAALGREYARIPVYSVILFGDHCSLREVRLTDSSHIVDHRRNLPFIVNRIAKASSYSNGEWVRAAYEAVYPLSQADRTTKARHVRQVKNTRKHPAYRERTLYDSADLRPATMDDAHDPCPLCGGRLVVRTAQKAPRAGHRFLGCANFPACRYTKNIDEDP